MKIAFAILLSLVLLSTSCFTQGHSERSVSEQQENIQTLIEEAISQNPEIAVEFHKMNAADQRIPQAGTLADPELVFKLMEIPGMEFNKAMYANVEFMQMVPFPTKLAIQRSVAEALSQHARHDHMEKVVQVVADLKTALAMLWFGRESIEINRANQELLQRVLKIVETSYSVGKASQQEIFRTNIELSKLSADEARIQGEIISAENMLRRILNRPADHPIGLVSLDQAVPLPPLAALVTFAEQNRPMLIHDSLNVVERAMNVRLMKEEYIPDLKFSAEYVRLPMTMENRWSFSAGITLPFAPWSLAKASARVQEAESERLMLASMYTASRSMVQSQIRSKYSTLRAIETQLQKLQQVALPQLSQSIDLLLTDYETGRTSYLMVLDGYRMYNEMKVDRAMALMNYHETLAGLEREVGVTDIHSISGKE